ncbi:4-amino-4-deoxy-L-arabinose transferase-like glycosyltransferase [Rhizobium azibense]|nr:4-amino-4-deoxy-L-arabinose transferase-like glycosyltransferase [Rhizobium azibense]
MNVDVDKARNVDMRWFFAVLAAYFLIQVAVRVAMPPTLGLDEAEQAFRSQWLAAGYGPQPPFYNWLQYAAFSISGVSLLSLAVVKNALLFTSYVIYGLTARMILKNSVLAVVATLGLLTLPQVAFEMQRDLTHTVAVFFAGCVFLYGFIRSLKKPDVLSYLVTGIGIGIGLLSKYNFALLPASALLAALLDPQMRKRVFDWRMALTAITALVIALPHLFWLKDNLGFATARTLKKLTDGGNASYVVQVAMGSGLLVLAVIGFCAVTLLVFAFAFGKPFLSAVSGRSQWTQLLERIMLFSILGILLLVIFGGAAHIKDRWLVPLFFIFPLYLCLKIEASNVAVSNPLRRLVPVVAIIMIAVPTILFGRIAAATLNGDYERLNVPYAQLAAALRQQGEPAAILAEGSLLAGNLRKDFVPATVISTDYPGFKPTVSISKERPLLVVWQLSTAQGNALPAKAAEWLRSVPELGSIAPEVSTIEVPYYYARNGDSYRFGYAWVAPAD